MLFYDGTWECYQGFHLSFALVSWFVWFLLIFMPIPLIYFIVRHGEKPIKICGREVGAIPPGAIECLRQGLRYCIIVIYFLYSLKRIFWHL